MKRFAVIVTLAFVLFTSASMVANAAKEIRGVLEDISIFTNGDVALRLKGEERPRMFPAGSYITPGMWTTGREIILRPSKTGWEMIQKSDFVETVISRFRQIKAGWPNLFAWGRGSYGSGSPFSWLAFSDSDGNVIIEISHKPSFPGFASLRAYLKTLYFDLS